MNNIKTFDYTTTTRSVGQVFTPDPLAMFMISLLKNELRKYHRVLDPCIGKNVFLSNLLKLDINSYLLGIESDESLITKEINSFYSNPRRKLIIDSFFNLPLTEKFDFIIQNPPYIRQELMMVTGENSKPLVLKSLSGLDLTIPPQSNLYVYFLLKSIFHLNDNGRMIAVIYDSWLYSNFGKFLKESFNRFGAIEAIYHFKKNAFPDIDVGATVIDFRKKNTHIIINKSIKLYSFKTVDEINEHPTINLSPKQIPAADFLTYRFSEETRLNFNSPLFTTIGELPAQSIQRGTSSIVNEYFIHKEKCFKESIPFIKDITTIRCFAVDQELSYLLALNGRVSVKTKKHLAITKNKILSHSKSFSSLKKEIRFNRNWYEVQLKNPGNILFNYYLRKNIDFILNEKLYYSSDNFYLLKIEKKLFANFSILNSSFTRIAILLHSRNQGKGLKKIQLYEFKKVPVICADKISENALAKLEKIGRNLKSVNRFSLNKEKMITQIDEILIGEYNKRNKSKLTLAQLYADMQNMQA